MASSPGSDHQSTTLPNDQIVEVSDERSSLLDSPFQENKYDKLWIFGLGIIFIVGLSVGIYLLCVEGKDISTEQIFLVPRASWSESEVNGNISKLIIPTQRILLLQTNSSECWDKQQCVIELQKLQKKHMEELKEPDILYNFILGGDGRVYEGRGWEYQSSYKDANEDILTIAFLGTYNDNAPSEKQVSELEIFLDFSVMENDLVPCFRILVRESPGRYIVDIALRLQKTMDESNLC